jgi:hypothetical protein
MAQHRFLTIRRACLLIAIVLLCGLLLYLKYFRIQYELWQNHRIWAQHHVTHYQYTLSVGSMGSPDYNQHVTIKVLNGQATPVIGIGTSPSRVGSHFEESDTVEHLFQVIQNAILRRADNVRVTFQPELGYPVEIGIDPSSRQADDEIEYQITDFTVLP